MTNRTMTTSPNDVPLVHETFFRRHRKAIVIITGILLVLGWLFDFNPLHPIWSIHEIRRSWEAGERAGALARERLRAREAAEARARTQASAPSPTLAPAH
jgi:hypothetical protein